MVSFSWDMDFGCLDKSNKQADAMSHSNDQNKVDSSKNMGFTNKDKVGFTPPPILKSILKNAVRKTQVVNTGNVASNSALNEVRTEVIDEGKTHQDVTGVSTQTTSPKNTSPLRPVSKPTNGGSSSSKPTDEAHTGKSLSPSKASNNDNLNVKGSDGGGSSYNSPLDSGNEPIQPDIHRAGFSLESKVRDIIGVNGWTWPNQWVLYNPIGRIIMDPAAIDYYVRGSLLWWNVDAVDLNVVAMDDQVVHTFIRFKADEKELFCSFVYAHNRCVLGDFNSALTLEDKVEDSSVIDIAMREFKECVDANELVDINRSGLQFTWNQKPRGLDGTLRKIDRIMANLGFLDSFAGAHAIFQPYRVSDHSPAILHIPTMCA
ncbi:RNA-directed DNA polymerase, eukaryota, Reverse transcriptase zinc-binding domain protein [Artemisia annua]|uniref:RNA-directed DNA polymerase, eukaryota, Reverse transcriptase zinc-binding domain protein n=1 Tax=Artemisia annua TaxID=35608 RepID=A0A2U1P287_ARTAN|nr:RNA-directed DNA polymerase, eukaryota, Reverse transcriptase zinc-binding domain protein [Artemisia annua]